eukprot:m.29104 g.29104  ORF g.29104 m.29104 type:complete len:50 (+) comp9535_c0_seq4:565-714(+)
MREKTLSFEYIFLEVQLSVFVCIYILILLFKICDCWVFVKSVCFVLVAP